jgi:hypothetical protein
MFYERVRNHDAFIMHHGGHAYVFDLLCVFFLFRDYNNNYNNNNNKCPLSSLSIYDLYYCI